MQGLKSPCNDFDCSSEVNRQVQKQGDYLGTIEIIQVRDNGDAVEVVRGRFWVNFDGRVTRI